MEEAPFPSDLSTFPFSQEILLLSLGSRTNPTPSETAGNFSPRKTEFKEFLGLFYGILMTFYYIYVISPSLMEGAPGIP